MISGIPDDSISERGQRKYFGCASVLRILQFQVDHLVSAKCNISFPRASISSLRKVQACQLAGTRALKLTQNGNGPAKGTLCVIQAHESLHEGQTKLLELRSQNFIPTPMEFCRRVSASSLKSAPS